MKSLRLVKKFPNLTAREESSIAGILNESEASIKVIIDYLEFSIVGIDKELNNFKGLYDRPDSATYVAAILARRATLFNLRSLLTEKVDLKFDDDHRETL
jgi:hypothetical protein